MRFYIYFELFTYVFLGWFTFVRHAQNNILSKLESFPLSLEDRSVNLLNSIEEGNVQRVVTILQSNVKQWSFIEAQLLEPNVNLGMPEIFIPLKHLTATLEILGNIFVMRNELVEAKNCLERACPLIELLPAAVLESLSDIGASNEFTFLKNEEDYLDKGINDHILFDVEADDNGVQNNYAVDCFALLRNVYMKLYGFNNTETGGQQKLPTLASATSESEESLSDLNAEDGESSSSNENLIESSRSEAEISKVVEPGFVLNDDNEMVSIESRIEELRIPFQHLRSELKMIQEHNVRGNEFSPPPPLPAANQQKPKPSSKKGSSSSSPSTSSTSSKPQTKSGKPRSTRMNKPSESEGSNQLTKPIAESLLDIKMRNLKIGDQVGLLDEDGNIFFSTMENHIASLMDKTEMFEIKPTTSSIAAFMEAMIRTFTNAADKSRKPVYDLTREYYESLDHNFPMMDDIEYLSNMEVGQIILETMATIMKEGTDFVNDELDKWLDKYKGKDSDATIRFFLEEIEAGKHEVKLDIDADVPVRSTSRILILSAFDIATNNDNFEIYLVLGLAIRDIDKERQREAAALPDYAAESPEADVPHRSRQRRVKAKKDLQANLYGEETNPTITLSSTLRSSVPTLKSEDDWTFHFFVFFMVATALIVYLAYQESTKKRAARPRQRTQKKGGEGFVGAVSNFLAPGDEEGLTVSTLYMRLNVAASEVASSVVQQFSELVTSTPEVANGTFINSKATMKKPAVGSVIIQTTNNPANSSINTDKRGGTKVNADVQLQEGNPSNIENWFRGLLGLFTRDEISVPISSIPPAAAIQTKVEAAPSSTSAVSHNYEEELKSKKKPQAIHVSSHEGLDTSPFPTPILKQIPSPTSPSKRVHFDLPSEIDIVPPNIKPSYEPSNKSIAANNVDNPKTVTINQSSKKQSTSIASNSDKKQDQHHKQLEKEKDPPKPKAKPEKVKSNQPTSTNSNTILPAAALTNKSTIYSTNEVATGNLTVSASDGSLSSDQDSAQAPDYSAEIYKYENYDESRIMDLLQEGEWKEAAKKKPQSKEKEKEKKDVRADRFEKEKEKDLKKPPVNPVANKPINASVVYTKPSIGKPQDSVHIKGKSPPVLPLAEDIQSSKRSMALDFDSFLPSALSSDNVKAKSKSDKKIATSVVSYKNVVTSATLPSTTIKSSEEAPNMPTSMGPDSHSLDHDISTSATTSGLSLLKPYEPSYRFSSPDTSLGGSGMEDSIANAFDLDNLVSPTSINSILNTNAKASPNLPPPPQLQPNLPRSNNTTLPSLASTYGKSSHSVAAPPGLNLVKSLDVSVGSGFSGSVGVGTTGLFSSTGNSSRFGTLPPLSMGFNPLPSLSSPDISESRLLGKVVPPANTHLGLNNRSQLLNIDASAANRGYRSVDEDDGDSSDLLKGLLDDIINPSSPPMDELFNISDNDFETINGAKANNFSPNRDYLSASSTTNALFSANNNSSLANAAANDNMISDLSPHAPIFQPSFGSGTIGHVGANPKRNLNESLIASVDLGMGAGMSVVVSGKEKKKRADSQEASRGVSNIPSAATTPTGNDSFIDELWYKNNFE